MIRETKAVVKDIRTDADVTADLINGEAFDIAIVATGAETKHSFRESRERRKAEFWIL